MINILKIIDFFFNYKIFNTFKQTNILNLATFTNKNLKYFLLINVTFYFFKINKSVILFISSETLIDLNYIKFTNIYT